MKRNTLESILANTTWVDRGYGTPCREWNMNTVAGYGRVRFHSRMWMVHRIVWILSYGDIQNDHEIHHLCHNKLCCNIDHLESTTHTENILQGPFPSNHMVLYCKRNHQLFGENLYLHKKQRHCKECNRIRQIEYRKRKKERDELAH